MKKIFEFLITNQGGGLFHDSRKDVNTIARFANNNANQINTLIDEVKRLKKRVDILEAEKNN